MAGKRESSGRGERGKRGGGGVEEKVRGVEDEVRGVEEEMRGVEEEVRG